MSADTQRRIKRLIDIVVSLTVLVLLSPVLAVAAILIRLRLGKPVVFSQQRTGRAGRPFTVYKLRTMTDERDADGVLLPDGQRCKGIGLLLRRASIDELPQLVNVLKGELSLVGPRPLLPRYDPWYTDRERLRFEVPPGITGLAQIHGRNGLAWNERLELDVVYVTNWSLWLELQIIARTIRTVLTGAGVAKDPSAQMLDLDRERMLT
ncbi:lipopolysaccharide/colanic/teichoic acid biosynthesis glycosyltransferase [Micromonospora luteifusca]|uniref:Lipopolysaccharide/colanic/teichoic acid biosynthesis glycosyltransferase n=1 Tax=Micromonospora luteifusca TaxID=709860 RepID=A0ABS2LZN2_9ACTN|nr:sugar transferase [Micromonospora luteifusca]MBM7493648.1 lipopolysaccharide/colanic/teichoic acid biosynthesis glycosyltransferase [Micromonospora luteifusca]